MADFDLPEIAPYKNPDGTPATATMADRHAVILKHATQRELEVTWVPLMVADRVELLVTADAIKLGGVRVNVSATCQQQLADVLGALLLTPKVADLVYAARAVTIDPLPMPITSSTDAMKKESARMDAAIAAAGGLEQGGIVGTVGKHWCIDNALQAHAGKAENYGWFKPKGTPSPWNGVAIYPSVTLSALVIQQPSWAHDASHSDYSQQCSLMHRDCTVDGQPKDLADVLADAQLGPLLSHNGPIPKIAQRQPGVPLFACAAPASKGRAFVEDAASSPLCPLPPPPEVNYPASWLGEHWPWLAGGAVGAAAAGLAWWRGWWPFRPSAAAR